MSELSRSGHHRRLLLIVLLGGLVTVAGLLFARSASASATYSCTVYWTGAKSSTWEVAGNWSTSATAQSTPSNYPNSSSATVCLANSPKTTTIDVTDQDEIDVADLPGATVTISGELDVASTSATTPTVVGNLNLYNASQSSGTFNPSGPVDVSNIELGYGSDLEGSGTVYATGTGSSMTDSSYIESTELSNSGTLTVAAGASLNLSDDAEVDNSGTLSIGDNATLGGDQSSTIVNEESGSIIYTGGSNGSNISANLTTDGTITAEGGTLNLSGNPIYLGADAQATTTTIGRTAGVVELSGVASPTGGAGSTGNLSGLTLNGGTITGPGTVEVPAGESATIEQGTLDGATVEVENTGTLSIPAGGYAYVDSQTLITNDGTIALNTSSSDTGTTAFIDDATGNLIQNDADGTITGTGTDQNQNVYITTPLTNAGTISAASTTVVDGGLLTLDSTSRATESENGVVEADGYATISADQGQNGALDGWTIDGSQLTGATGAGNLVVDAAQSATFDGVFLEGGVIVQNYGTASFTDSPTYFDNTSSFENYGTVQLANGTELIDEDNSGNSLVNEAAGTVQFSFTGINNTDTATLNVPVTNKGTIDVGGGTLDVELTTGGLSVKGVLTQGTWDLDGTVEIDGDSGDSNGVPTITTNDATIDFECATAANCEVEANDASMMAALTANGGSITSSTPLTDADGLTNTGTIDLLAGTSTFGSLTQSGTSSSSTTVGSGATLSAGSSGTGKVTVIGGALEGFGTVKAAVADSSGGTVSLGIGAGGSALSVTGTYTAAKGSTTDVTVNGSTTAGVDFGQLAVTGAVTLNGTLSVTDSTGFSPTSTFSAPVVTGSSIGGFFSAISAPALTGGLAYSVAYSSHDVYLVASTVVPTATSVSPNKVGIGASGKSVTIIGTNFATGATLESETPGVTFSSVTVSSATKITAKVTVTSKATTGATNVLVTNTSGGSAVCAGCLTIDAAPTIKTVSPTSAAQDKTVTVTITGTGFATGVSLNLSGTGLTISSVKLSGTTKITFTLKVSKTAAKGSRSLTITNADGGVATKSGAIKIT